MSNSINIFIIKISIKNIINFVLVAGVIIITLSCESTRMFSSRKIKPMSTRKIYNNVLTNHLDYESLSLKFTLNVKSPKKKETFHGNLRIRKDSIIWISLRFMIGTEYVRVMLSPDSVKLLNRLNTSYFTYDYDYFKKLFATDLGYYSLQSILTNHLFIYPFMDNMDNEIKHYKSSVDKKLYKLESIKGRKLKKYQKKDFLNMVIDQKIFVHSDDFKVNKIFIKDYKHARELNLEYSEYTNIDSQNIPKEISIELINSEDKFNINLKCSKITINKKDLSYSFRIPEKYNKIK